MPLLTAPPTSARDPVETDLLLTFLRDRNFPCPRCHYNLRNLTQPTCPECKEDLRLSVGQNRVNLGWLVVALAPGIFSGIAAFFVGCMLIMVNISPTGKAAWQLYVLDAFGWLSAAFAVALFFNRFRFLRQQQSLQITIAASVWTVHVAFFLIIWSLMR